MFSLANTMFINLLKSKYELIVFLLSQIYLYVAFLSHLVSHEDHYFLRCLLLIGHKYVVMLVSIVMVYLLVYNDSIVLWCSHLTISIH